MKITRIKGNDQEKSNFRHLYQATGVFLDITMSGQLDLFLIASNYWIISSHFSCFRPLQTPAMIPGMIRCWWIGFWTKFDKLWSCQRAVRKVNREMCIFCLARNLIAIAAFAEYSLDSLKATPGWLFCTCCSCCEYMSLRFEVALLIRYQYGEIARRFWYWSYLFAPRARWVIGTHVWSITVAEKLLNLSLNFSLCLSGSKT